MTAQYQLWFSDELGNRFFPIDDTASFEYTRVIGDVGVGTFTFPYRNRAYQNPFQVDRRIVVLRSALGGLHFEFTGFMRNWKYSTDRNGQTMVAITCVDQNDLLRRRIIAYYGGEAETEVTGAADDLMKEVVRDNFIDNADYSGTPDPARDIDDYGFSVATDTSAGPSLTKEFAWTNVLDVLQDLQADSKTSGTEVFFGVVAVNETALRFETWTGQPGTNRTQAGGANPIIFSTDLGNLSQPQLEDDFLGEITHMYAGGRGQNGARVMQSASDASRVTRSRFNRVEGFVETGEELNAPTLAAARRELGLYRPRTTLTAALLSTDTTPYGSGYGWFLGDRVTVNYTNRQFDVIVRSVHVKVDATGKETIMSRVENE